MTEDEATALVAESINYVLERTEGVSAVIENTAGQGSNIGYTFEHLAAIIAGLRIRPVSGSVSTLAMPRLPDMTCRLLRHTKIHGAASTL